MLTMLSYDLSRGCWQTPLYPPLKGGKANPPVSPLERWEGKSEQN